MSKRTPIHIKGRTGKGEMPEGYLAGLSNRNLTNLTEILGKKEATEALGVLLKTQ